MGPLARRLPALTAVALIAIGLLTITGRLRVDVAGAAARDGGAPAAAQHECH
jgi:hypothetical protein